MYFLKRLNFICSSLTLQFAIISPLTALVPILCSLLAFCTVQYSVRFLGVEAPVARILC